MIPFLTRLVRLGGTKPYSCLLRHCGALCPASGDGGRSCRRSSGARSRRPARHPRQGNRRVNGGQVLAGTVAEEQVSESEFDPIYETVFSVSCCPLLSQARAARRELRGAEPQGWRSCVWPGAATRLVTPRHRDLPPGRKTRQLKSSHRDMSQP